MNYCMRMRTQIAKDSAYLVEHFLDGCPSLWNFGVIESDGPEARALDVTVRREQALEILGDKRTQNETSEQESTSHLRPQPIP